MANVTRSGEYTMGTTEFLRRLGFPDGTKLVDVQEREIEGIYKDVRLIVEHDDLLPGGINVDRTISPTFEKTEDGLKLVDWGQTLTDNAKTTLPLMMWWLATNKHNSYSPEIKDLALKMLNQMERENAEGTADDQG